LQPTARGIENCDAPIASPDLDHFALGKLGCVLKSSLIVLAVDVRSALEVPVTPYKVHFIVGHFHHPEKRQARLKRKAVSVGPSRLGLFAFGLMERKFARSSYCGASTASAKTNRAGRSMRIGIATFTLANLQQSPPSSTHLPRPGRGRRVRARGARIGKPTSPVARRIEDGSF
jgi:hypothetical protein